MAFIYGAIAKGWFEGIGWRDSLGFGGVDRGGQLRDVACSSQESARRKALKAVGNRVRYKRNDVWIDFRDLNKGTQRAILSEVGKIVSWVMIGPTLSRVRVNEITFQNAMQKVLA
jgi:hypothetical protein